MLRLWCKYSALYSCSIAALKAFAPPVFPSSPSLLDSSNIKVDPHTGQIIFADNGFSGLWRWKVDILWSRQNFFCLSSSSRTFHFFIGQNLTDMAGAPLLAAIGRGNPLFCQPFGNLECPVPVQKLLVYAPHNSCLHVKTQLIPLNFILRKSPKSFIFHGNYINFSHFYFKK